ncbi:MAG: hypothetical protein N2Z58_09490 [Fervidobacterium sp.]|nr:hypothetical protein [Fervidobacterium sp.]
MGLEVIRKLNKVKPHDLPIEILLMEQNINFFMKGIFPEELYLYLLGAKMSYIADYLQVHPNTVTNRVKKYLEVFSPHFYKKDELDFEELAKLVRKLKLLNNIPDDEFVPVNLLQLKLSKDNLSADYNSLTVEG